MDFSVVIDRMPLLLWGVAGTLWLSFCGITIALVIGISGVVVLRTGAKLPRMIVRAFVELIRNTPFLVQIFFIFFALPYVGIRLSPTVTAMIALGINGGAYAIEIIRGGVESIPKGQTEAGLALGMTRGQVFRDVVLIPALRAIYPALCAQFVLLTLTSAVCASISAHELTLVAQRIESETFRSFEVYFTITGIYLVLSWLLMLLLVRLGHRIFAYSNQ